MSPSSVDSNKAAAAPSKAAELEGILEMKEVNVTQKIPHTTDPEVELDTDLEDGWELPGVQCWEVQEEKTGTQIVSVQGRLRQNLEFWQHTLNAPDNVLEWIQTGYKLPLQYLSDTYSQGNHKSTLTHHEFVTGAIAELLVNRCVKRVTEKPFICSPLSLVENSKGKLRLVLNLRYLN